MTDYSPENNSVINSTFEYEQLALPVKKKIKLIKQAKKKKCKRGFNLNYLSTREAKPVKVMKKCLKMSSKDLK